MESREAQDFTRNLEDRLGRRIVWRTFATWYGSNEGIVREYGVYLCTLDDGSIYLEDFERLPQILGYQIRSRNTPKYEKYSLLLSPGSVRSVSRVVKKQAAASCLAASRIPLASAGRLATALFPIVTQLETEDGRCLYFELIDHKAFMRAIGGDN